MTCNDHLGGREVFVQIVTQTFSGPPSGYRGANLYQHCQETIRLVKSARQQFPQDQEPQPSYPFSGSLRLAENRTSESFSMMTGEVTPTSMRVRLAATADQGGQLLTYQESADERVYGLPYEGIEVRENPQNGAVTLSGPARPKPLLCTPGPTLREAHLSPHEPWDSPIHYQARYLKSTIDREMALLQSRDDSSEDLNPTAGLVIAAGFGQQTSPEGEIFATEAELRFDPGSGRIQSYARGLDNHAVLSFRREGLKQIYLQQQFLGCRKLEILPDGAWHFTTYLDSQADPTPFQEEKRMRFSILEQIQQQASQARSWLIPPALGAAVGLAMAHHGTAAGLVAGLTTTVALGISLPRPTPSPLDLPQGVYRFFGETAAQQQQTARSAFLATQNGRNLEKLVRFEPPASDRQQVTEFLRNLCEDGQTRRLVLLVKEMGAAAEPALVVVDRGLGFPLQTDSEHLILPGGKTIDYHQIEAMTGFSGALPGDRPGRSAP